MRARSLLRSLWPDGPWAVSPYANFIDFDYALRQREDVKSVIYRSIQDLKKRHIVGWLDIDRVWQDHQSKKVDHGNALALLGALEFNLKANGL